MYMEFQKAETVVLENQGSYYKFVCNDCGQTYLKEKKDAIIVDSEGVKGKTAGQDWAEKNANKSGFINPTINL